MADKVINVGGQSYGKTVKMIEDLTSQVASLRAQNAEMLAALNDFTYARRRGFEDEMQTAYMKAMRAIAHANENNEKSS